MNLIELLFFALAIFLRVLLGRWFFGWIGWWAALPGAVVGFGLVWGLIKMLHLTVGRAKPSAN